MAVNAAAIPPKIGLPVADVTIPNVPAAFPSAPAIFMASPVLVLPDKEFLSLKTSLFARVC